MTFMQRGAFVSGVLGLGAIAMGILAHGATLATSNSLAPVDAFQQIEAVGHDPLWAAHLQAVDRELARGHVDVAVRLWHDAHAAALESRSWEAMIAVGDAFMRIGRAAGAVGGARMNAREAYV